MSTRVSRVSFKSFAIVLCYVPLAPIFYFVMPLGIEREYGAFVHWNVMSLCLQYLASVGWRFRFAGVLLLAKLALCIIEAAASCFSACFILCHGLRASHRLLPQCRHTTRCSAINDAANVITCRPPRPPRVTLVRPTTDSEEGWFC